MTLVVLQEPDWHSHTLMLSLREVLEQQGWVSQLSQSLQGQAGGELISRAAAQIWGTKHTPSNQVSALLTPWFLWSSRSPGGGWDIGLQLTLKYELVLRGLEQVTVSFLLQRNSWIHDRGVCSPTLSYAHPICLCMRMMGLAHITFHPSLPAWQ